MSIHLMRNRPQNPQSELVPWTVPPPMARNGKGPSFLWYEGDSPVWDLYLSYPLASDRGRFAVLQFVLECGEMMMEDQEASAERYRHCGMQSENLYLCINSWLTNEHNPHHWVIPFWERTIEIVGRAGFVLATDVVAHDSTRALVAVVHRRLFPPGVAQ